MANATHLPAPIPRTQEDVIFLDPESNVWDRREWESLWAMDELQASGWQYLNTGRGDLSTSGSKSGWVHRFVNGRRWLVVPAYHVWVLYRRLPW